MNKESFLIYKSFYEPIKFLDDEKLGKLFRAIFEYQINNIECQDMEIRMAFEFFKNQFRLDDEKYQKIVERNKENGKKGGRPKQNEENPKNPMGLKKPKKADNDNEKDNDNDNEKDNDITNTSNIYEFLENNFGRTLNPIEYEEISNWEDNELTRYAIKQAILNGKYGIKYISSILNSYKMKNIKTIQQAQQDEEIFKKSKENRNKSSREKMDEVFERFLNAKDEDEE